MFSWSRKVDHAGLSIDLELFKFDFGLKIYDGRHWNEEEDRYYIAGEDEWEGATSYIDLGRYKEVGEISLRTKNTDPCYGTAKAAMQDVIAKSNLTKVEDYD
jgi:hypothetical protein